MSPIVVWIGIGLTIIFGGSLLAGLLRATDNQPKDVSAIQIIYALRRRQARRSRTISSR